MSIRNGFFWLLCWLCSSATAAADPALVGDARITERDSGSQLVFDLSRPVPYRYFHLDNPPRLVLDLRNARLAAPIDWEALRSLDVIKVRSALRDSGATLRMVMELRDRIDYKTTLLESDGYRLVVDFFRPRLERRSQTPPLSLASVAGKRLRRAVQNRPTLPPVKLTSTQRTVPPASSPSPPSLSASASTSTSSPPVPAPATPAAPFVIAIDAGHGGKDPGAVGAAGTYEKDVVLEIARRFRDVIDTRPGLEGCLTRDGDRYLGLSERLRVARRRCKANLFISIHADAYHENSSGASVFVLSTKGASSAMARFLASEENRRLGADERFNVSDKKLKRVLLDMVQDAVLSESRALGGAVLSQLGKIGKLHGNKRVEHAGFAVLKAPDIPSILVETAFISNPDEERKLRSGKYQQKIAEAMLDGVEQYLRQRPQLIDQSALASR